MIDPDAQKFIAEMGSDAGKVEVLPVGGSVSV